MKSRVINSRYILVRSEYYLNENIELRNNMQLLSPSHEPSDNVTILSRLNLTIERVQKLRKRKIYPQFP